MCEFVFEGDSQKLENVLRGDEAVHKEIEFIVRGIKRKFGASFASLSLSQLTEMLNTQKNIPRNYHTHVSLKHTYEHPQFCNLLVFFNRHVCKNC